MQDLGAAFISFYVVEDQLYSIVNSHGQLLLEHASSLHLDILNTLQNGAEALFLARRNSCKLASDLGSHIHSRHASTWLENMHVDALRKSVVYHFMGLIGKTYFW